MNLQDKQALLKKLTRINNELGYDVGLLSTGADEYEAEIAHIFSNAVDQLRNVQRLLGRRVSREATVPTVETHGYSVTDLNDAAEASETIGDDALETFAANQRNTHG